MPDPLEAMPEAPHPHPAASATSGAPSEAAGSRDTDATGCVDEATPRVGTRRSRLLPPPVWHIGRLLVVALIIEYLVVPQLAGPGKLVHLLATVNPLLLLLGVALEAASLLSYSLLTQTVMPGRRLGLWTIQRIQLTTLSVSHCTPGGSATGAALGYRLMTQAGASPGDVGFALGVQGLGSALVLNVLLWISLAVSLPIWGASAADIVAAIIATLLFGLVTGLFLLFTRGENFAGSVIERVASRLPFVDGRAVKRSFVDAAYRLRSLAADRHLLANASGWASANWLLDAASLWVFVGAFGKWVNPVGLLVAYGLAQVLAVLPITPGGLGLVEASLTSLLVGYGASRGVATLGVIGYRLINFWAPIPIGGLAYLSLQADTDRPEGRSRIAHIAHRVVDPLAGRRRSHG
jgi:uncharacterized protein (TIRG00374 family)